MIAKPIRDLVLLWLMAVVGGFAARSAVAAPVQAQHVEAELVAESPAPEAGRPFTVALRLKMDPHWHVYWKNPGDAGLPVSLEWTLPAGYSAGPIQWPYPERIAVEPLLNYGYEGEILLPVEITPPAAGKGAAADARVELKAKAKWVVCKEICLPGNAELTLALPTPVAGALPPDDPARAEMFRRARARLPLPSSPWTFSALATDSLITLVAKAPPGFQGAHPGFVFFPEEQEVLENAALQSFYPVEGGFALDLVRIPPEPGAEGGPDSLAGVAVSSRGWDAPDDRRAVEIRLPLERGKAAPKALAAAVALGKPASHADPGDGAGGDRGSAPSVEDAAGTAGAAGLPGAGSAGFSKLLFMLSFAFLGGLILNLMPCVLPVLSLKIFDFVKRSGESRLKVFLHGIVFTGGVLVSFWVLAGLLLVLRQGGQELGWGFQLQSPSFLMVLCALFFFFSLNLFGVFELGYLFTRIGTGQNTHGHMGSFVAGVTATVVATPCTAPFMGSAMGYAFSQPPAYALLVFTFLGLGMASPYLLLAGFPALMRFLPKPGEWMEHLKQFMGFPLLGTAIWLAWVLGKQAGVDALVALLFVLLLAGLSAWILGKWTALHRTTPVRVIAGVLALVIFLPAFVLVLMFVDQQRGVTSPSTPAAAVAGSAGMPGNSGSIAWEPFSPGRLEELLAQGKPVFIDFTADWCLSCKVNEKVALEKPEVAGRFRDLGVAALKADWTLRDEAIARALAKYGRNSIPLYVLYTGNGDEHVILPEILTPATVLDALAKLEIPATTLRR